MKYVYILVTLLFAFFSTIADAKPSTSKPSFSKPSVSKSTSSSSSSSKSGFSSKTSSGSKNAFDSNQAKKAVAPPKPKAEYVEDFKKQNAAKYPTTFDTPPATRPAYIPPTTNYNGHPRQIEYNPQTRSYGFFDDLGKFMIYDAITDIALDSFKKDTVAYNNSQSSSSSGGSSIGFWGIVGGIAAVAIISGAAIYLINKSV